MAEYHLEVKIISRKGGSASTASEHRSGDEVARFDACSASGYRNGQAITNEQTGVTFYQKPEDLARIVSSHVLMPHKLAWDASKLWNEVDRIERRKDSVLAKDVNILLPHEWTLAQRETYALAFAKAQFTDKGIPCEVSFHRFGKGYRPNAEAWKERQAALGDVPYYEAAAIPKDPAGMYVAVFRHKNGAVKEYRVRYEHVHIQHPTRTISADGTWSNKLRAAEGHNLKGEKRDLLALREAWANHANQHLETKISHLSLEAQRIDRVPQIGMGALTALYRQGSQDQRVIDARERIGEIRRRNDELRERGQLKVVTAASVASLIEARDRRQDMSASDQYPNKYEEMRKEQEAAKQAAQDAERAKVYEDRAAEIVATTENMRRVEEKARVFNLNQHIAAEKAKKELEEEEKRGNREAREGSIANAERRYAEALGRHYDIKDPYGSLARSAMHEYAAFNRRQQELADKAAKATDPSLRKELQLTMTIEGCDYMRITSERLCEMNKVIGQKTGIEHKAAYKTDFERPRIDQEERRKPQWERDKEAAQLWKERGQALREQRHELVEAREKPKEQEKRAEVARGLGELARDVQRGRYRDGGNGAGGGKGGGGARDGDSGHGSERGERGDRQQAAEEMTSGRLNQYEQTLAADRAYKQSVGRPTGGGRKV